LAVTWDNLNIGIAASTLNCEMLDRQRRME